MKRSITTLAMIAFAIANCFGEWYIAPSVGVLIGGTDTATSAQIGGSLGVQITPRWGIELDLFGYDASSYDHGINGDVKVRPLSSVMANATYSLAPDFWINPFVFAGVGAGDYEFYQEPFATYDANGKQSGHTSPVYEDEVLATAQAGVGLSVDVTDIKDGLYFDMRTRVMHTDSYSFANDDRRLTAVTMMLGLRFVY